MYFSAESIVIILLVGLVGGLLPSTSVRRTRVGLIGDIAVGIVGVVVAGWLAFVSGYLDPMTNDLPASKPPEDITADLEPRYEAVVLPLAPLRPLLNPVVYRWREEICDPLADGARRDDLP